VFRATGVVKRWLLSPHLLPRCARLTPMTTHTILFLAANSFRADPFAFEQEASAIDYALHRSQRHESFELIWATTPLRELRELRYRQPTVVHFSGHNRHADIRTTDRPQRNVISYPDTGTGGLYLEDEDGSSRLVSGIELGRMFSVVGASLRLVMLSGCDSEPLAAALADHVDYVVGTSEALPDRAVRSFALAFYAGLAEHESVQAAYARARAAHAAYGFRNADLSRLLVRDGVDASQPWFAFSAEPGARSGRIRSDGNEERGLGQPASKGMPDEDPPDPAPRPMPPAAKAGTVPTASPSSWAEFFSPRAPRKPLHEPHEAGRSVDIALHRSGFASELARDDDDPTHVQPTTRLGARRHYKLLVQIGAALDDTLFAAPPPSIDPLLPPSADGHRLEVTVFAIDFALTGTATRELWLPNTGPTKVVVFSVRAPDRPGPARLRIVISHDGHALQSFIVTAQIAHTEEVAPTRALNATLEYAATRQFANLAALRKRDATAVINDDPVGGHSITLKRGETTGTFTFSDDQIRTASTAVRAILEDAARAPSFDEPPPRPGTPAYATRAADHDAAIRKLAALGANLHLALFDHADRGGKQLIQALMSATEQRLQLIHVARSLVIPWAVLYDGWIPDDLDTSRLPVCHGALADGSSCAHTEASELICVRRFWGLRHDLELVLGSSIPRDAVTRFRVPSDRPPLRVLHGRTMQDATFMPDTYTSLMYQPGVPVWEHDVYTLFEGDQRPAILVAMGHFSSGAPVPGTLVHAIDLVPKPLTNIGVTKQTRSLGDWAFPHSIVLLMACSSAAVAADALTGMIDAFGSAGAAAIIGTESTVFPRLSGRAAASLYRGLVDTGGQLAGALRALRWELMRDATPLAFAFTAYGNADLAREDAP